MISRKTGSSEEERLHGLVHTLFARIRELEELYEQKTGEKPPPAAYDLSQESKSPRAAEKERKFADSSPTTTKSPRRVRGAEPRSSPQLKLSSPNVAEASVVERLPDVDEMTAALSHPIHKEGKTPRDRRMEVLAATQAVAADEARQLMTLFLTPLRNACAADGSALIVSDEFEAVYAHLLTQSDLFRMLSEDLGLRVSQWTAKGECVGDILHKYAGMMRSSMTYQFNAELDFAMIDSWRRDHEHHEAIDALIGNAEKAAAPATLHKLMAALSSRMLMYAPILEELLKQAPKQHADRPALQAALQAFKELESGLALRSPRENSSSEDAVVKGRTNSLTRAMVPNLTRKKSDSRGVSPLSLSGSDPHSSTTLKQRFTDKWKTLGHRSSVLVSSALANGSPPASMAPVAPSAAPDMEPMSIADALAKLLSPEGCDEEFETVFLGMHHYFMSWHLLLNRFRESYDRYQEETNTSRRSAFVNRLVQIMSKWLRLNPTLRNARMTEDEMEKELRDYCDLSMATSPSDMFVSALRIADEVSHYHTSDAPLRSSSGPAASSPGDSPRVGSSSGSPRPVSMSRASMDQSSSSPRPEDGTPRSARNMIELEDYNDDSDASSEDVRISPVAIKEEAVTPPAVSTSHNNKLTLSRGSTGATPIMGSRKRQSAAYAAMAAITKTVSTVTVEALDKHLNPAQDDDGAPPALTNRNPGERPVYFLTVMDEWMKKLHQSGDSAQALLKYWDQWKFPKKTRLLRRDSVYYRSLQKSKAAHSKAVATGQVPDVLNMEPRVLANQLSLQELNTFKDIPKKELFNRSFMEAEMGVHFQFMVSQFNVWCAWVVASVLGPDDAPGRAAVLTHFIEVADLCHEMNNFNTSYAIVGGLNHPQLARLKQTWDLVGKKAAKKYERLLQQWDVSGNYRKYRDVLKSTAPPCVPYLGLLGKDLWSIEENSKTLLTKSIGARTVVNFKAISFVETLQQYEYPNLEESQQASAYLACVPGMTDAEAKARSHSVEPRQK